MMIQSPSVATLPLLTVDHFRRWYGVATPPPTPPPDRLLNSPTNKQVLGLEAICHRRQGDPLPILAPGRFSSRSADQMFGIRARHRGEGTAQEPTATSGCEARWMPTVRNLPLASRIPAPVERHRNAVPTEDRKEYQAETKLADSFDRAAAIKPPATECRDADPQAALKPRCEEDKRSITTHPQRPPPLTVETVCRRSAAINVDSFASPNGTGERTRDRR